jgi:hypothetical protein
MFCGTCNVGLLLEWWEEIILSVLCCVLNWVWWLSYWCSFVIFMVTTLFTKKSKICWILTLVYENFDYSSTRVCNVCNKKEKCVVYGRHMFLNAHTGHYTNLRTPNLIMFVSLTSHCCVGSADDIGYNALRSMALHCIVCIRFYEMWLLRAFISVDIYTPYFIDSQAVWRCSYMEQSVVLLEL